MPSIALPVSLRGQLLSGTRKFSPASLFSANEPGVWFDPSDLTTLFQDTAGTTPVTAPGNTVGLMLDKSKGLALGAELVANGDFAANVNDWPSNISATWDAGAALLSATSASAQLAQSFSTVVGRTYRLNYQFVAGNPGNSLVRLGTAANDGSILNLGMSAGAGSFSRVFVATSTTTWVTLFVSYPSVSITGKWDNISVRELAGNHATQATIAARPTYSIEPVGGRRNLLTWSEDFSVPFVTNTGWSKVGVVASGSRITANAGTGTAYVETVYLGAPAGDRTISVVFPSTAGRHRYVWIGDRGIVPIASATFDLNSVSVVGKDPSVTATVVTLPDGSVKCSVTHTRASIGGSSPQFALAGATYTSDRPSLTWAGGEFLDAKMQFELGSTATAYQKVTTQHDVTEAGVASVGYLYFDGAGDAMATSTITPGTDKAQVFAGITRPTATSTYGLLYGLGSASSGGFETFVPTSSATQVEFFMQGFGMLTCAIPSAPFSAVLTQAIDRALPLPQISARLNGTVLSGTSSGSAQTGNFLAYPLYIGARAGTSLPLFGHLYSLITRFGPTLDAPTITSTETWVAGKTGFYTPVITGVPTIGVS